MQKRFFGKTVTTIILLFVVFFSISTQASVSWKETATLYPKQDKIYQNDFGKYVSKNQQISAFALQDIFPESISSSRKSVAVQGLIARKSGLSYVYLKLKKTGKTIISGKDGSRENQYELTVMKYKNPFSSIMMNKKNITGKFTKRSVIEYSFKKFKNKKIKLSFEGKGDWHLSTAQLRIPGDLNVTSLGSGSTVKIKKKGSAIYLFANNNTTHQSETCQIIFK